MPNIKGIDLSDGIKILSGTGGTDIEYPRVAMVVAFGSRTIAQCETIANNFLASRWAYDQIKVHIYSLTPLRYTTIVANWYNFDGTPYVIPDNWWGE